MEKNLKIFLIILAVLAVVFIIWGIMSYFSKGKRKGRAAERKVAGTIKKIGKKDNVRIINNAFLPLYRKTVEIDHLVFGRFGVLVIETKGISGSHKIQGIGAGFVPEILNTGIYDEIVPVSNEDAYSAARLIAAREGVLVGISSGAALHAAIELAKNEENREKTVVVLLPDTGERYLSSDLFDE